jgi:hypothetical protein
VFTFVAWTQPALSSTYRIDPDQSVITILVFRFGLFSFAAPDQ